ncbi:MAG: cytochrome C biogenesis protein [Chloroflexi bacterium RBG_13_54_9]|nr:MAG: cytochrome C biogenesis protein [Chloroflexi bacterium RBG_13_54_9]
MADIGYISLLLALGASLYSALAFVIGVRKRYPELVASARNSLLCVGGLVSLAALALVYALLTHDFQIESVAYYTSRDLPLIYTLSAFWAGNAGSLLFWAWLLSLFAAIVAMQNRGRNRELLPYAGSIMMATEAFFLILMIFLTNPFQKLLSTPAEGSGLNPLLENVGMIFHPPALLAGYVGLTVPFAFAMAALLSGRLGDDWMRSIRRWALLAWLLLGLGNLLGAQWAYVELGWGGYWSWDPVENAGLMPWLVATAFLHSAVIQRRRGMLKVWNMVLIMLAFNLSIFGTFLTRSGILSSVHTFSESAMGPFFLGFMGVVLLGSLILIYYHRQQLKSENELDSFVSRESAFLLNNLLLVGITFAILVGTIFPAISEAVRGVKIAVGTPFFNKVTGPVFLALILLMGICPLIGWRRARMNDLIRSFIYPLGTATIVGVVLFLGGIREWYALVAFSLCSFVISAILFDWFRGVRARHRVRSDNYLKAFLGLLWGNKPRYGGYIVHIAILLIATGVVGSSFYKMEKEVALAPGEAMTIKNYTLIYEGKTEKVTQSKLVTTATLSVFNGVEFIGTMTPEKYFHRSYQQPVTEVALRSTLLEDLYVVLGGWTADGTTTFKVLVNPLVSWIWMGGGFLFLGGLIAFWPDKRERR